MKPFLFDWRSTIRWWRNEQGLTRLEAAVKSGLSVAAVRAYESGARQPSRRALQDLIDALGIPKSDGNFILAAAGFSVDLASLFDGRLPPVSPETLAREVDAQVWPAFTANPSFDVLAANRPALCLFDLNFDVDLLGFGERNLLGGITHEEYARRILNWDEVVEFICGLAKGDPRWGGSGAAHPSPWLRRPVERLQAGSPARIQRLAEIWQRAEPIGHRVMQHYCLELLYGETPLQFACRMVMADVWSELHYNEWIPANTKTWSMMETIVAQSDGRERPTDDPAC
jgi:transcriptional regulator with XRE-family HTH domain